MEAIRSCQKDVKEFSKLNRKLSQVAMALQALTFHSEFVNFFQNVTAHNFSCTHISLDDLFATLNVKKSQYRVS